MRLMYSDLIVFALARVESRRMESSLSLLNMRPYHLASLATYYQQGYHMAGRLTFMVFSA